MELEKRKVSKQEEKYINFVESNNNLYADASGSTPTSRMQKEAEEEAKRSGK